MRKVLVAIGAVFLGVAACVELTVVTGLIGWQGLLALLALGAAWSGVEALQRAWRRWRGRPDPDQSKPFEG